MAYSILNNKLLAVEDDLYMQKALKEFLGLAVEVPVCFDREKAPAFMQAGDISDVTKSDVNISKMSRF